MTHTSDGVLRRLLDEPAGVADTDRQHVVDCSQCLDALATMREDAALVDAALTTDLHDLDVDAAWRRLSTAVPAGAVVPTAAPRRRRALTLVQRPAVAALAAAAVVTGAGTAAANGWLPIFRTEQVVPVSLRTSDLVALPDLSAYGELAVTQEPDVHAVRDAGTAEAESGIDVPEVTDLPRGISGEPTVTVGRRTSARFTFSAERAARSASAAGQSLPPVPPGLDGSAVLLAAGPGVAQVWSSDAGAPGLVVARVVAPTAFSSGVDFETVRDYLLSLPGLPADVAAQLRTFAAHGSTLPLPVPADEVTTSSAEVDGADATVLETRDRSLAAVVWVDDGEVTAVAGSLDTDELLSVARDLG